MADLQVPARYRAALIQLAKLSDEAVAELCRILESNPEALTARDKAYEIADQLATISASDGAQIFDAVIPLLFIKASTSLSTAAVLKDVVKALKASDKEEDKLAANSIPRFQQNLGRFLDLSGVALKTKALSLATDCPRLFTEAKIISDIRPVFGADVSRVPLGAVVVHSLRITFSEDSEEKEYYVQLDVGDLKSLQELVGRAIMKDASLKSFLADSKLQLFETSLNS